MNRPLPVLVLLILLTGCGGSSPENNSPDLQSPEAATQNTYECESGNMIVASYPSNSTAVVEYEEQILQMTIALSASGARYIGDEFVWWTKGSGPGSEGTLYRLENGDTTGEILEQCKQASGN